MTKTLAEKVWEQHVVRRVEGEPDLLYIDLHLLHEVTSPQAFDGLRLAGRSVRRTDLTIATEDHNVPTTLGPISDPVSRLQIDTLRANPDAARAVYDTGVKGGDFHAAHATVGEAVGLVHDLPGAGEVVARMDAGARAVLGQAQGH